MRIAQKPIIHGRDHMTGGPDPIPGLLPLSSPGSFAQVVDQLGAFWYARLGEASTPWEDTSGVAPQSDLTVSGSGTAPTFDVTGALPVGDDDGAVQFNYDGTSGAGGKYLHNSGVTPTNKDFSMQDSDGHMTVAVWARVTSSALTRRGIIIGNTTVVIGSPNWQGGWGIQVIYPTRKVRFSRGQASSGSPERYAETAAGVIAGDWNLFVGTYDRQNIKLYVNGALQDTFADTSAALSPSDMNVGHGLIVDVTGFSTEDAWFYGAADEAVIFDRALTANEIASLYQSGLGQSGEGEQVLISDGQGGAEWGQLHTEAIQDQAVTSLKIADGTIVDADVDAAADIGVSKLAAGMDGQVLETVSGVPTWTTESFGGDPADDTSVWMPLTSTVGGDDVLVFDADSNLIPTLTPI